MKDKKRFFETFITLSFKFTDTFFRRIVVIKNG